MKRITLNERDSAHIYELALGHFQDGCIECEWLRLRFEKFIGLKEVRSIKRRVKKNPYCGKKK